MQLLRILKKTDATQGMTLIELLLYVAIASILLLALATFISTLLAARIKNQTTAEVEQQGAQITQHITQTLRNAATINTPVIGTSANSLSVNTYTAGNNPTVYDISSGALRVKQGAGSAVPMTNSRVTASGLSVQNLSHINTPGTIRVTFTLTYVNPNGRQEYSYSQTFRASASMRQP